MPFCFGWRSIPFWCCFDGFVSGVCASLSLLCPVRPAGGRDRACLSLNGRRRCSSACGARCRVLATWGPLLVPCSLCSPASEILWFFLRIFRSGSSRIFSSHCWSLLNGDTSACSGPLSSLAFGLATAVFLCCRWVTHGYGWSPALPSFGRGGLRQLLYPCCLVHRLEFLSGQSWPLLDFP